MFFTLVTIFHLGGYIIRIRATAERKNKTQQRAHSEISMCYIHHTGWLLININVPSDAFPLPDGRTNHLSRCNRRGCSSSLIVSTAIVSLVCFLSLFSVCRRLSLPPQRQSGSNWLEVSLRRFTQHQVHHREAAVVWLKA